MTRPPALATAGLLALTLALPAVAGECEYPYGPVTGAGVASLTEMVFPVDQWRLLALAAVPSDQPWAIEPGHEYFALAIVVRHLKTVGTGACSGCATPLCLGFFHARIVDAQSVSDIFLYADGPNTGGSEETVTWQGAYVRDYQIALDRLGPFGTLTCDPDASSSARSTTWGAVKSLYR
jgi:hypothetical protein